VDTLTASNYFTARDDCEMTCPIGAGRTFYGLRHNAGCGAVADTGYAYRETVARAADALLPVPTPDDDATYVLLIGDYETEIVGVTRATDQAAADAVAAILTAQRANGYTITSGPLAGSRGHYPRDLIAVRAEIVNEYDSNGGVTR
jgi:hypothetical protein